MCMCKGVTSKLYVENQLGNYLVIEITICDRPYTILKSKQQTY